METSQEFNWDLELYPRGLFFIFPLSLIAPIFLIIALVFNQIELTVFSLLLTGLAIGLRLWSQFSTKNLDYTIHLDRGAVFPGETIHLDVTIANNKLLPVLTKIRLAVNPLLRQDREDADIVEDSGILWYQTIRYSRVLTPLKRGVYNTGAPLLITGDLFGFFPKRTEASQNAEILVYPKLQPIKSIALLRQIMLGKISPASPIHDPIYILGTRDYESHSPGRNIHWKASARFSRLREKIFEPTEQEKITLVFEVDEFVEQKDEDAFESAIEIIASLGIELNEDHYAVGFLSNCQNRHHRDIALPPVRRASHVSELLTTLAEFSFEALQPIAPLLSRRGVLGAGVSCVYFSYYPLQNDHPVLRAKAATLNIVACRHRPDEDDSPEPLYLKTIGLEDLLAVTSHG